MSKILITGSNGFLGSRLSRYLIKNNSVKAPLHSEMNFTNLEDVMDVFSRDVPDLVIHCGAISDVRACEANPKKSYDVNVLGTENIAKACQKYHSKMIFCSSDQIYFEKCGMKDHHENEKVSPINEYGKQKLKAEDICLSLCSDAVCLRLSWMYDFISYREGEHKDLFRNIIMAIEKGDKISYPVYDYRGITYVQNVLKNIEKAFLLPGGVYNFGSENDKNTYETIKALLSLLGKKDYSVIPNAQAFADNPRNIKMNTDKIKSFGIEFPNTVQGFKKCVIQYNEYRHMA
jgi:dTDP-4-dehydrorhamnose reductase